MDLEKVRELIKLVEESRIDELEIADEEVTIRIQKHSAPTHVAAHVAAAMPAPAVQAAVAHVAAPADNPERARWKEIRTPIVGTFYRAPSPEAPNFVEVGDVIKPGQTLCIIEAMKVMNEIEAEISGVVKEILVVNASPVEAEGVLFLVDPS